LKLVPNEISLVICMREGEKYGSGRAKALTGTRGDEALEGSLAS